MSGLSFATSAAVLGGLGYGAYLLTGRFGEDAKDAAQTAAQQQTQAAQAGIGEQRRQFDVAQGMLDPYAQAGAQATQMQADLAGINGPQAQAQAMQLIQGSPQFAAMQQQGEQAILRNASATGNLRTGNAQAQLAQLSPALLAQLIDQRYGQLGGMAGIGAGAAGSLAAGAQGMGQSVADLMGQQGAAQAGATLAGQQAQQNARNQVFNLGLQGAGLAATAFTGMPIPTPKL